MPAILSLNRQSHVNARSSGHWSTQGVSSHIETYSSYIETLSQRQKPKKASNELKYYFPIVLSISSQMEMLAFIW